MVSPASSLLDESEEPKRTRLTAQMLTLGRDQADGIIEPSRSDDSGGSFWSRRRRQQQDDDYTPLEGSAESPPGRLQAMLQPGEAKEQDSLEQDCPFFYKAMDAVASPQQSPRYSTLSRQTTSDLSFRHRYEQLNQELDLQRVDRHNVEIEHDLTLAEHVQSDPVEVSTLYYLHHGRLILQLPQDKVRLIMDDPDCMEAGMLAVEYADFSTIRYVLTVPPDLYQRVVQELSYEKMDIRVALGILGVFFLALLITTTVWPVE